MPLNFGAPIGSDAYTTASTQNIYANTYGRATTAPQGTGKETSNGTRRSFRYPLKRLDETSDYLEIKIYDYIAEGFSISELPTPEVKSPTVQQRLKAKKTDPKCYIFLPIPQNIGDTISASWGDDTINALEAGGIAFGNAVQEGGLNAFQQAAAFLKQQGGAALQNEKTMKAVENAISGAAVGGLGGNVSASGLIARATGMVMNNNLELLFQGVTLRSFPFTFDLAPRSKEEAQEILQIIRILKKEMTARYNAAKVGGDTSQVGLFISSPSIFQLTYKSGPKKHPFLHTFKPCALTGCAVNYTASGTYATYDDGSPVHMQLSLEFKELNPIYSEDYDSEEASRGVGY